MISIVIVVLAIILIGRGSAKKDELNTIKIGAVLPMTGIAANYGENHSNAIKLAINEINAGGGVLGKKLELVLENDGTDPKRTVAAFQKLTDIDKVSVVIGGVWDFLANAVMPVIDAKKITTISPSTASDMLDKTSDAFFTVFPPISIHQPIVEKYLKAEAGEKVAIIYINNAWGKAHLETYKKAVTAAGKTLVKVVELSKFDNNDIQREITLLKSDSPDILLTAVNLVDPKLIIEKNKELALNAHIFGHDNILASYLNQGINNDVLEGTVIYRLALPDNQFIQNYKSIYGKDPISEADKAYDAVYIIKKAIELSKDTSSQGIALGIRKIKNYDGVSGPLDYTSNNWPTVETARLEIFDGKSFVPYLEEK